MSEVSTEAEQMYLITKGGAYYRHNAEGYTRNMAEAGRYTLTEAVLHSHPNGRDGPRDGIDYEPAPPVATPEPAGDLVERQKKVIDAVINAYHSTRLIEVAPADHIIRKPTVQYAFHALFSAIPDRAALVATHERDILARDVEIDTLRLSNDLLEQFSKSDLEELAAHRTQFAASQADVARLREVLFMIEAIGDGSKTANSLPNIAGIARAAIKDTQP